MKLKSTHKKISVLATGSVILGALIGMPADNLRAEPLSYASLGSGAELRQNLSSMNSSSNSSAQFAFVIKGDKASEGKCGEGKCGEKKASDKAAETKTEAKTTEAKCGEGKCGDK